MKNMKKVFILLIGMCVLFTPIVNVDAGLFVPGFSTDTGENGNGCVIGPKVAKDIEGALDIFRIVSVVILITYTIFEVVSSLTKGDGQAELKKVFARLKKRFFYLILLCFLPTLIKLAMNAMGVTGGCDLTKVIFNSIIK